MKRILVTGANGQLGLSIRDLQNEYPDVEFVFKTKKEFDITDSKQVNEVFSLGHFDYCINCAAYTNVEQAEKTPEIAYKVNAYGVRYLAEACKENNVVLIHISTDYVFDGDKEEPYTVDDIPNPINEYGKSKWEGEKHVQEILSKYFIVRTSWLYHKEYGKNFYKTILEKANKGEIIKVTDEQVGCPTNAINLAQFILYLINYKGDSLGFYHFTDGEVMTWFCFAKIILTEKKLIENVRLIKNIEYKTFSNRPTYSVLKSNH